MTEHAYIETEDGDKIECTFNPDKLTIIKTNNWPQQQANGRTLPHIGFGGGTPAQLKVTLTFDTTEDGKDVREVTSKLIKLMKVGDKHNEAAGGRSKNPQKRPPTCTFVWGTILSFKSALTSLQVDLVLFKAEDGTPVRAMASCTFTQMQDEDDFMKQNPTSGGRTGERIYRLGPRETLDQVAYEAFGDTALWRGLAAFNGIDDPMRVTAGQVLLLPPSADDLRALG